MNETTGPILFVIAVVVVLVVMYLFYKSGNAKAMREIKDAWDATSDAGKQQLFDLLPTLLPIQKIVTCSNCVVVYQPAGLHGLKHEIVEQKIRAIMDTNPHADLMRHQQALGIKIIDIQSKQSLPLSDRSYL